MFYSNEYFHILFLVAWPYIKKMLWFYVAFFKSVNYDLSNHLFEYNIDLFKHNLVILHNEMFSPILTLYADVTYFSRSRSVDSGLSV